MASLEELLDQETREFKVAVEEWRAEKAAGGGEAVVIEAGGDFAKPYAKPAGENPEENESDDSDTERGPINFSALEDALSPATLAALRSHVAEQAETLDDGDSQQLPSEDFGMSQFWWDDDSSERLAMEAVHTPTGDGVALANSKKMIAILSAPSVWFGLKRAQSAATVEGGADQSPICQAEATLLEYDKRFGEASSAGASFVYYDYAAPEALPPHLHKSFDYLFAGPPYVSEACIDKYLAAFDLLARHPNTPRALVIGASLEDALAARGFIMDEGFELGYQSKFCTPMRLYRK